MQILKGLYQVGGDINGLTFDQPGALWNDGNSYILKTAEGLIMFDVDVAIPLSRFLLICSIGIFRLMISVIVY